MNNVIFQWVQIFISGDNFSGLRKLNIHSDSTHMIFSITKWITFWKANNWKTALGYPVKIRDELERLDEAVRSMDAIKWVSMLFYFLPRCWVIRVVLADWHVKELYDMATVKLIIAYRAQSLLLMPNVSERKGKPIGKCCILLLPSGSAGSGRPMCQGDTIVTNKCVISKFGIT